MSNYNFLFLIIIFHILGISLIYMIKLLIKALVLILLFAKITCCTFAADFDVPINGTLSQAITAANNAGFVVPYQISISSNITATGLPIINVSTSIFSDISGTQRTVSFSGANRLNYNGSAISSSITDLNLTGSTIGSIISQQILTVTNTAFNSNTVVGSGGAITNNNNSLTLNAGNIFTSNKALGGTDRNGGAVYNSGTNAVTTVTNNSFSLNTAYNGGAIWTGNGAQTTVNNSTFTSNSTTNDGGGLYVLDGAQTTVNNSVFTSNNANRFGGAITSQGSLTLNPGNQFINNNANSYGGAVGLGVIIAGSTCSVNDNFFQGNTALNGGGGAIANGDESILTITDSQFEQNSARFGGALWNGESSPMTVDSTIFTQNASVGSGSGGGAIYTQQAGITTLNAGNVFTSNTAATGNGGAIYNIDLGSLTTINQNTFNTNSALLGGALYNSTNANMTLNGANTFTSNTANTAGGVLYNTSNAIVTINSGSTFTTNSTISTTGQGGAIYSNSNTLNVTTLTVDGADFEQNSAGLGGAVYINATNAFANISASVFNQNVANSDAGSIWNNTKLILETGNLFQNNTANGTSATTGDGGAIKNSSSIVINSNTFNLNHANYRGGAIYNNSNTVLETINDSIFTTNSAALGGAIYNGAGTISNTEFTSNSATFTTGTTGNGGAIYNTGAVTVNTGSTFTSNSATGTTNTATGLGGAIYNNNAGLNIDDVDFITNTATAFGGAIYNTGGNATTKVTIGNSLFSQNTAPSGGGAIYNTGQINLTTGNTFNENKSLATTPSTGFGGAIYNNSGTAVLNIDGNTFTQNEANYGGAIYNFNGTGATVNILNSTFDANTAVSNGGVTGSGGAVYNRGILTAGDGNSFVNNTAATDGGVIYNTRTVNIIGDNEFSDNTATTGKGGAIYNALTLNLTSTSTGDITFLNNIANGIANDIYNSVGSATININGLAGTVEINSGISGVGTINKSNNGTFDLSGNNSTFSGTFNQSGGLTVIRGNSFNSIHNISGGTLELAQNGTLSNSAAINIGAGANFAITTNDNISFANNQIKGLIGAFGTISKSGTGTLNIDNNMNTFKGAYTQTAGSTIVSASGLMFGGQNIITDSLLEVTGSSVYYNTTLGDNGTLRHFSNSIANTNISSLSNFNFTGTGANATFTKVTNLPVANYTLVDKIEGSGSNTLEFDSSNVKIGSTDFTGNTIYSFVNSNIDIRNENLGTKTFSNLDLNNARLSFNLSFENTGSGFVLDSDKLSVSTLLGDTTIGIAIINVINDDDDGLSGIFDTKVLTGLEFSGTGLPQLIATTAYEYSVDLKPGDNTSIELTVIAPSSSQSLYNMNNFEGNRGFNFSFFQTNPFVYNIDQSLGVTKDGNFVVQGHDADPAHSVISGVIAPGQRGSFFNLTGTTDFLLQNLTMTEAFKTGDGSVLFLTGPASQALIFNVIMDSNDSTGNGGTIYQNAGTLNVVSTKFSNNTATNGGAIAHEGGSATIINSTFDNNSSSTGNGGAIYNNSAIDALDILGGSVFSNNSADGRGGAIYNSGVLNIDSTLGDIVFFNNTDSSGTNDIYNANVSSEINIIGNNNNVTINGNIAGLGTINKEHGGILTLNGDNSQFTGDFIVNEGQVILNGRLFGGNSLVDGGSLFWQTTQDKLSTSILTVTGISNLTIGSDTNNVIMTLNNASDSVTSNVNFELAEGSILNNEFGTVSIGSGGIWRGTVINENILSLDNFSNFVTPAGTYIQTTPGAVLNIQNGSELALDNFFNISAGTVNLGNGTTGSVLKLGSSNTIVPAVIFNIDNNNLLQIEGAEVILDSSDSWDGLIELSDGNLFVDNLVSNGDLIATGGNFIVQGGSVEMGLGSLITSETNVFLPDNTTMDITGGDVSFNNQGVWGGTINLNSGILKLDGSTNSATSVLNQSGGLFILQNGSVFVYDNANTTFAGGDIALESASTFNVADANTFTAPGDLFIGSNSSLNPGSNNFAVNGNLTINGGTVNSMNTTIETNTIANNFIVGSGGANFTVDLDALSGNSDSYIINTIGTLGSEGIINISDFNLINFPTLGTSVTFRIFNSDNISPNVIFTATKNVIKTPTVIYALVSDGGGYYTLGSTGYNSVSFRGQVATLAAYNNQLTVNNALFDHIYIDSENLIADNNKNKYVSISPLFAPYQYSREDGSVWYKTYLTLETLSMTHSLNVHNDAYGSLVGVDFSAIQLQKGWKFLPTAYIGYNGGHQTFDGVGMYQNGGQGGFMGTFMKDEFIASILAYGGGYLNDMSIEGFSDTTGNWFAGTAVKSAYNLRPSRNIILQPNVLVSYNAFGEQNWGSDFGALSMQSGLLNGINVAPGINLICGGETWNVYGTVQYMFYINDNVNGSVDNTLSLPDVSMRHGYIEYGAGATKTWKERLLGYLQITFRNGGRTGVGFQAGLSWKF